jgi:flagellar basal body-associated protein FliL
MSDHGEAAPADGEHGGASGGGHEEGGGGSKTALIVPLLNSVILLLSLGFLAYTKLVFKRPVITEEVEKARVLEQKQASPTDSAEGGIGQIPFDPITVNILSSPDNHLPIALGSPGNKGKAHFLTVQFTLEVMSSSYTDTVQGLKPFLLDRLIQTVGKKSFSELATVQGRYILRSELMELANKTLTERAHLPTQEKVVTNLYFTTFVVE